MTCVDIDWVERWQQIVESRLQQTSRVQPEQGARPATHWDNLATRFSQRVEESGGGQDQIAAAIRELVQPTQTLLDVGAGAGRYTVRLAPHVQHLVAVEPSSGMRGALEGHVAQRGLRNVTVVASTWEEAAVEPADVVLSVNVIYWTTDVVPFLRKLQRHARERCLIILRATQSLEWIAPLWQELRGEAQAPQPSFLDLYNLLFQVGARPNAQLFSTQHQRWETIDEAVDRLTADLLVTPGTAEASHVRRFVEAHLRFEDGYWVEPTPTWVGLADIPSTPAF